MNKQDFVLSLTQQQHTMVEQLYDFCAINSGTENLPGLSRMHQTLASAYAPLSDHIETVPLAAFDTINMQGDTITQHCGDGLLIRKRPELTRRILLSGHMDTVYSMHSPFQQVTALDATRANGPGVSDMKGGLLVMLHALTAFEQSDKAHTLGWDVFINSEEEIGSPSSSAYFAHIANHYEAGLVYEPAMDVNGTLAKNRRGSGKLTLIAQGKAAHAGRAFHEGRNAICYLAEAIILIHQLNGQQDGVTINIGKIAGGEALNMVPDKAVAQLDVRINHPDEELWVRQKIDAIIKQLQRKDYSLSVHGHFGRPVKRVNKATERLFNRIQKVGSELGLTLDWKDSGGCCDGNNLAQHGLPVIDTLGVRGGNIHSSDEYIVLDSLVERAMLSALLLHDLASGGLEEITT